MDIKEKKDTRSVKAVHDFKFESFLEHIGVYEQVMKGEKKCKFCMEPVSLKSITSVFAESGDVKFVCDKPACIASFSEFLANKQ